jgi:hypothetical protein
MKNSVLLLLVFSTYQICYAQRDTTVNYSHKKSYWCDIGIGWGGQGNSFNVGLSLEITPQRILSIHSSSVLTKSRCHDYLFMIPIADYPLGNDAQSYEITYGLLKKGKAGIMTFSAGLCYVKIEKGTGSGALVGYDLFGGSTRPVNYHLSTERTVGLALRAQILPSLRSVGLGISPYVIISPEYTFASLTFQLAVGRLKPKVKPL